MEMKWISHPNLPGQETEVPAQSVGHHAMAGWVPMDEPPEWFTDQENRKAGLTGEPVPEDAAPESPSDAPSDKSDDADADKPTNKRVRRVTTEESK